MIMEVSCRRTACVVVVFAVCIFCGASFLPSKMAQVIYDIEQLYRRTFGSRYVINGDAADYPADMRLSKTGNLSSIKGSALERDYGKHKIWLPILFTGLPTDLFPGSEVDDINPGELLLPFAGMKISGDKTIVQTPLAERQGTVKELYSIDDYQIQIRGFAIDQQRRVWPEEQLIALKDLYKYNGGINLDNAISNILLDTTRVVVKHIDWPEVSGSKHIRPFVIDLLSDSVFELEV